MTGYLFRWHTSEFAFDTYFQTEDRARMYAADIWEHMSDGQKDMNLLFEILQIKCSDIEWRQMRDDNLDPSKYIDKIILTFT